jgi:hypothetical protein
LSQTFQTLIACHMALGEQDKAVAYMREIREPAPSSNILSPLRDANPGWARQLDGWITEAERLGFASPIV